MSISAVPSSTEILTGLEERLAIRLPPDWSVRVVREPAIAFSGSSYRPDAVLSIVAPDGTTGRLFIEFKASLYPRDASALRNQLMPYQLAADPFAQPMVVSRFLTPRTREMLEADGFSYADATGNVRVVTPRPPFFIELRGAEVNPWKELRPLKGLGGPTTAAVVRALLDFKPPYTVSELASRAGLELTAVSRTVSLLSEEAILRREGRGPIIAVDWEDLLRRWASDYDLLKMNFPRFGLEPRGVEAALSKVGTLSAPWAITGSVAAQARVRSAPPALLAVYVEGNIGRAATELGLIEGPGGPNNVLLLGARSRLPFERTWTRDDRRYVALSQVAVDLLSGPGRSPSEAEFLIEWMKANEDAWRSP
jgi:hypothetical protein